MEKKNLGEKQVRLRGIKTTSWLRDNTGTGLVFHSSSYHFAPSGLFTTFPPIRTCSLIGKTRKLHILRPTGK